MKCKKCNAELAKDATFCNSCGTKVVEEAKTEKTSEGSSFGWGVLGFFVPIVGLILFLVWRQTKKNSSKASGIGALIGAGVGLIGLIIFLLGLSGLRGIFSTPSDDKLPTYNITIQKVSDLDSDITGISSWRKDELGKVYNYMYRIDLDDENSNKNFYDDVRYIVNDTNNKKLFELVFYKFISNGQEAHCKFTLPSGDVIWNDECILYDYDFSYSNGLIVFGDIVTMKDDFYVYDVDEAKLTTIFKQDEDKDFEIVDFDIDNKNSLVFKAFFTGEGSANEGYRKSIILRDIENPNLESSIKTKEQLNERLTKEGVDNFIVEKTYTFNKETSGYALAPAVKEKTVTEYFEEINGLTETPTRTEDCTGTISVNNYGYLGTLSEEQMNTCKTVTYKLNDDFTMKLKLIDDTWLEIYINDVYITDDFIEANGSYGGAIVGKTFVTREFSTDIGALTYLVNTKGEIYNVNKIGNEKTDLLQKEDGMITKNVSVNDSGDLVVTGSRHSNISGEYIGGTYVNQVDMCSFTFEELAKKYNVPEDYAFVTEYTYKIKSDGLFDMNYSSKNTVKSWKDAFKDFCN